MLNVPRETVYLKKVLLNTNMFHVEQIMTFHKKQLVINYLKQY